MEELYSSLKILRNTNTDTKQAYWQYQASSKQRGMHWLMDIYWITGLVVYIALNIGIKYYIFSDFVN